MKESNKEKFLRDGYVIIDVLTAQEVADFRKLMDALLSPKIKASNTTRHTSSYQHFGDEIQDFGKESRQYYFHLLTKPGTESIHQAFHHPVMLRAVEGLIGPDLIVNNASILAANEGTKYSLGWHRDIIAHQLSGIAKFMNANRLHRISPLPHLFHRQGARGWAAPSPESHLINYTLPQTGSLLKWRRFGQSRLENQQYKF